MLMKPEQKQEFTRRIINANKSDLVVILYDMFHQDVAEAIDYCSNGNHEGMHSEISGARLVLSELINSLDREYEVANNLYSIYRFVERRLIEADIKKSDIGLYDADRLMSKLGESFKKIAVKDNEPPIMQNVEKVYAGVTYGKGMINETSASINRGMLA